MYLVRDVMSHAVLYVTPEATVRTAVELLRANQLDGLPVVEDDRLIGLVDALSLFLYNGEVPLRHLLAEAPPFVSPDSPVGEAATQMRQLGLRQLPVVRDEKLIGLLTDSDLLSAWGASPDVLTGLPWQDHLRRWASQQLRNGHEICLLFVDLDDFGALNKEKGHVYGDRLLKIVGGILRQEVDAEMDCLCRYGGDEFAIATLRSLADANEFAHRLIRVLEEAEEGESAQSIPASIGVAGGKRKGVRPGTHPAAALDDLINIASRASTQAKLTPGHVFCAAGPADDEEDMETPERQPHNRILIGDYSIAQGEEDELAVTVELRVGEVAHRATASRPAAELRQATAEATTACLIQFVQSHVELEVEEVYGYTTTRGVPVCGATLVAREEGQPEEKLVGATPLLPDTYRSVMSAVLDAANRRLTRWMELEGAITGDRESDGDAGPSPAPAESA